MAAIKGEEGKSRCIMNLTNPVSKYEARHFLR
jgi:hypothetical protein